MENMIKQVTISNLFGDKNIDWQLQKTNVLVGKNGTGKSTILQLIIGAITKRDSFNKSGLCNTINVLLHNDDVFNMTRETMPKKVKENLIKALRDNPEVLKKIFTDSIPDLDFEKLQLSNISPKVTAYTSAYEEEERPLSFEFISTINLNANSNQNISFGNGEIQNILDLEIKTELDRLFKIQNTQLNQKLIHSLNEMFSESEKKVRLNSDFELEFQYKDDILYFPQLSSGERQVIYILLKVAIATQTNALILMDEPEISLHLSWQEKLLSQIRTINPDSQIIIVTHSPAIVMNGWLDCFVDIQDIIVKDKSVTYTIKG